MYTYLVFKKYSSETTPLNATQVAKYIMVEFDLAQQLDRRTIYAHFVDLQTLAQCYPEHIDFTFYRQANGAVYVKMK